MNIAKKNHFNPCFWTAYWNRDYYAAATTSDRRPDPRNQRVFALNVKANKVLSLTVENVHFDKHLGVAEITPDELKAFCRRNFPDEYESVCRDVGADPETVYLDFEPVLSTLENSPAYQVLHDVIPKQRIETQLERSFVASFIYIHMLRGHAILNSLVQLAEIGQRPKFELFWAIKHALGDPQFLGEQVTPFYEADWVLYRSDSDDFALCDSPILGGGDMGFVALSPHLLLQFDLGKKCTGDGTVTAIPVTPKIQSEFQTRTIGNTFREIISSNRQLLDAWQQTPEFERRHEALANENQYNQMVAENTHGELWKINALGYGQRSDG
ncbi:MAG: hypothetical protein R3C18_09275 [Planctomycetaceae bacterium]